ncbi:MAG: glycosyltransferase family 4 protein, partial [Terracidiphilus sp.]
HLSVAASEANRRGILSAFLTGAYSTALVRSVLSLPGLRSNTKLNRLLARAEPIDDNRVHALFLPELMYHYAIRFNNESALVASLRAYGRAAIPHVKRATLQNARIYHDRAGFGGDSLTVARELGLMTLCDHSACHPAVVEDLVNNRGELRHETDAETVSNFWRYIQSDIDRADAVLLNSAFVETTFRFVGCEGSRLHVIYLGVDGAFLSRVPQRRSAGEEIRLLFAGHFNKWKGAGVVIDAIRRLGDFSWRLEIAGTLHPQVVKENQEFFSDPRVKSLGMLSRKDLAGVMSQADVFLCPSFAEGSARVIFEALACGCYVITTPNSGSIVEDRIHGALIPPGDSPSLAEAIEFANAHRSQIAEIGRINSLCVRANYRQSNYGDQLEALYKRLLDKS